MVYGEFVCRLGDVIGRNQMSQAREARGLELSV